MKSPSNFTKKFEEFYRIEYPKVVRKLRYKNNLDKNDAEDLAQDIFLEILKRKLNYFDDLTSFYKLVKLRLFNYQRKLQRIAKRKE